MIIRKSLNHLSKYDVTPDGKIYLNEKELKQQGRFQGLQVYNFTDGL